MTNERRQLAFRDVVRPGYVAAAHSVRACLVLLLIGCWAIRRVVHFVLVPHVWKPTQWQRSPLSQASTQVAHAMVDAALVVGIPAAVVGLIWW